MAPKWERRRVRPRTAMPESTEPDLRRSMLGEMRETKRKVVDTESRNWQSERKREREREMEGKGT